MPNSFLTPLYRLSHRWGLFNLLSLYWCAWFFFYLSTHICAKAEWTHYVPLLWIVIFGCISAFEIKLTLKLHPIQRPAQSFFLITRICLGNAAGLVFGLFFYLVKGDTFSFYLGLLALSLGTKFVLGPLLDFFQKFKFLRGSKWIHLWGIGGLFALLFSIFSAPNSIGFDCGHYNSSVKANMHTVQTMLETYGVDWGGTYPATFQQLEKEARTASNPYWKDFFQPYTDFPKQPAYTHFNPKLGLPRRPKPIVLAGIYCWPASNLPPEKRYPPGRVIFTTLSLTQYFLYGTNRDGYIIEDNKEPFVLSSSNAY